MISVLIPVFNGETYLAQAIQSVLNQTYRDFEIIVIDDGSADKTAEVVRSFPEVRYVYQIHCGVSAARNRGVREAKGDIIAFLDADDAFAPSKLEKQVDYLQKHEDCVICYTQITNFSEIPPGEMTDRQRHIMAAEVEHILPSACIRRSVFEKCGYFDLELTQGEDTEWDCRVQLMKAGKMETLDESLYQRRIHAKNTSLSAKSYSSVLLREVKTKSLIHMMEIKNGRKVSVIIPAYNAEKYLDEAVQSVYRQNWIGDLELIIVDNHSTDYTLAVAQKYNCILLQEPRKGAAYARNCGLAAATGDFIVLLDADDCFADGAADVLFKPMHGAKSADAVFANAVDFISPELPEEEKGKLQVRNGGYSGVLPGCSLIRRSVFERVGLFDTSLAGGETIDWMMRLKEQQLHTVQLDSIVLNRRLHLTNTGRVAAVNERQNYAALLRKRMMKNG